MPANQRVLLGPGPSLIAPRVMRALAAPMLSHLDPDFVTIMDDLRACLARVFQAPDGALTFAVSGTGTAGMETAVANLVAPETRVLSVVTGYFAERLAPSGVAPSIRIWFGAPSRNPVPTSSPSSMPRRRPAC